jgi:hypothetical protein
MTDFKKQPTNSKTTRWGQAGKLGPLQQAILARWDIERNDWVYYNAQVRIFDTPFAKG